MARTAREGSNGENISHITGVRMRIVGQGSLLMTLYSLQDVNSEVMNPLTMQTTTNIQPFLLANFMEQRASLELETNVMNDYFRVNRIILFTKPTFTMYPG